ncbi:MAG: phage antirepressor KilAC domain-containing protein [Filimonas sp.]|nr:phage antirepressor KilAC domain-containing protein [Filimonas sp.]
MNQKDYYTISQALKMINLKIGQYLMGRNIFFEYLRELKVLQKGKNHNKPCEDLLKLGWFKIEWVTIKRKSYPRVMISKRGINWIKKTKLPIIKELEYKHWQEFYPNDLHLLNEVN